MSSAIDRITFTEVPGAAGPDRVTVYALSTCAFCKRALEWLNTRGLAYRYVYLDLIDVDLKRAAKAELKQRFDNLPVFPILTIGEARTISGFIEDRWAEAVGTPS